MYVHWTVLATTTLGHLDQSGYDTKSTSGRYPESLFAKLELRKRTEMLFDSCSKSMERRNISGLQDYHSASKPVPFCLEQRDTTVTALTENTYVDNIMETGSDSDDLRKFKEESSIILEDAKFPIHKWESNIACLEDENMPNPNKILGHVWDKQEDTLEFEAATMPENQPVTKRSILSRLGRVYDPLGMVSPTMAEGKHIFRDACKMCVGTLKCQNP